MTPVRRMLPRTLLLTNAKTRTSPATGFTVAALTGLATRMTPHRASTNCINRLTLVSCHERVVPDPRGDYGVARSLSIRRIEYMDRRDHSQRSPRHSTGPPLAMGPLHIRVEFSVPSSLLKPLAKNY